MYTNLFSCLYISHCYFFFVFFLLLFFCSYNLHRNLFGETVENNAKEGKYSFPMLWYSMNDRNNNAAHWGKSIVFKIVSPPSSDGKVTLKFVDSYGNGWEEGKLSIYTDINLQDTNGLLPIERSWTRQDSYNRLSGSMEGQNGDQQSGTRTCHKRWSNSKFADNYDPQMTHVACRDLCRRLAETRATPNEDCSHYSWQATGKNYQQGFNNFDRYGPTTTRYDTGKTNVWGLCSIYSVDYALVVIDAEEWSKKYPATAGMAGDAAVSFLVERKNILYYFF